MAISASGIPILTGSVVQLRPLAACDSAALLDAADGKLWNTRVTVIPGPDTASMAAYIARALEGRKDNTVMPFVVVCRDTDRVVGSTRFWKIDRANRKLEIGHTWLSQSVQGSAVNTEAKYLLLRHAFEAMDCIRVQFTTDELNTRSRAAILRLGATQEGIIRHERIMPDGRKRNSVRFSIIDSEWHAVKRALEGKLQARRRLP